MARLSLNAAAVAMGKSPRQVAYLIKKGELKAEKVGRRWVFDDADLPLTEGQRRALARKRDNIEAAAAKALAPGIEAGEKAGKRFSMRDLKAWKSAEPAWRAVSRALGADHPAASRLREALSLVAEGCHAWRPEEKAQLYSRARASAALAVADLLLDGPAEDEARLALAAQVEGRVLGDLSALVRNSERRARKARFEAFGARS